MKKMIKFKIFYKNVCIVLSEIEKFGVDLYFKSLLVEIEFIIYEGFIIGNFLLNVLIRKKKRNFFFNK